LYRNLIERNCKKNLSDNDERVYLPFIIIHTKKQTTIECEMSEDRTEYFFDFSLPFSIHDDNEILKRMGLSDPNYISKLSDTLPGFDQNNTRTNNNAISYGEVSPPQPQVTTRARYAQQIQQKPQPHTQPQEPTSPYNQAPTHDNVQYLMNEYS